MGESPDMSFRVVAVGKLKDNAIREACSGYADRINHYMSFDVIEVRDSGKKDREAVQARAEEGRAILKTVRKGAVVVALTRLGKADSSSRFASRVGDWRDRAMDVVFIIGGAHGLDAKVLERADWQLSLSKMTMPHELARLTLLEQLYRACTILRGEPYHKGG